MRTILALVLALGLFSLAPSASAQYCWDTVCAAGTPAANCWRAWCQEGWSYPAYPYRAPTWYRADAPLRYSAADPVGPSMVVPLSQRPGCRALDQLFGGC